MFKWGRLYSIFCFLVCFFVLNINKVFAGSEVYNNPGQGVFQCHSSTNIATDYIKGGSVIVRWDRLQPDNNDNINETALTNLINEIKLGGKKKYLHFQIYGGGGQVLPLWMRAYDFDCDSSSCRGSGLDNQCKQGNVYDPCFTKSNDLIPLIYTAKGVFPRPWDAAYQGYLQKFLNLLSQKFDERGVFDYIEYFEPSVGGNWAGTNLYFSETDIGNWAEAAGCGRTDFTCLGQNFTLGVNKIVDLYMDSFLKYAMMIVNDGCMYRACNYSGHQYLYDTYGGRVMIKGAGLGSMSDGSCGWRNYFSPICAYNSGGPNGFLTKCGQETGGDSSSDAFFNIGCEYNKVYLESLKREAISYYCMYGYDIGLGANQTTNRYVADHTGAQITLISAGLSGSQKSIGDTILVSIGWQNTGSAPLIAFLKSGKKWGNSSYKLFLEFVNNGSVKYYQELDINPPTKSWNTVNLFGSYQTQNTFVVPLWLGGSDTTSQTNYQLYAGLVDPNREQIRFALRNTDSAYNTEEKKYLISNFLVVIGKNTCLKRARGDANCDNLINGVDFQTFRQEYYNQKSTYLSDFNASEKVDFQDYKLWKENRR